MAYLEDIPKYAFGTAFEIDPDGEDEFEFELGRPAVLRQLGGSREGSGSGSGSGPGSGDSTSAKDGVTLFSPGHLKRLVAAAIRLGCRHFDCAPLYKTQPLVGAVMREAVKHIPRQKFFFTSKVPPNMMRPENLARSVRQSIEELQVSYLDLVLLHAPFATQHLADGAFYPLDEQGNLLLDDADGSEDLLASAWRQLVELKRQGLTRYIGLSNVNLDQLVRLNSIHQVDVVQNEYHIYNQNRELFDHCEEIDVHFEAYAAFGSPLAAKRLNRPSCFTDPTVLHVARANRLSVAQVTIQWIHQQPLSYVVRCDSAEQLRENLRAIKHIVLPLNDLIELDSLNRNVRIYYFDEHPGIERHCEYPFDKAQPEMNQRGQRHNQPVGDDNTRILFPERFAAP